MRLSVPLTRALPSTWEHARTAMARWWQRNRRRLLWLLVATLTATLAYGVWPYATLWNLNQALLQQDRTALTDLIDLTAIRREIARRLDKDRISAIDSLSDDFIRALESEIRRHGANAVNVMVTLDWVSERLLSKSHDERGFLPELSYGFFDGPTDFKAYIGPPAEHPVNLRLHLEGARWRLAMLAY